MLTYPAEKTAIYGKIKHELNCVPVKNAEYEYLAAKRAAEALDQKPMVKFVDASKGALRIFGSNTIAAHERATGFIVSRLHPDLRE